MAATKKSASKSSANPTSPAKATPTKGSAKKRGASPKNGGSKGGWPDVATNPQAGPLTASDAYEIGRLISERFQGEVSLRRIGEREQLRLSPGALHRCLAVYRVCTNLQAKPTWAHLGFSHLNRLDALTPQQQKKLATLAEKQKWSVDRIEREVTRLRQTGKKGQRRGRPALPRFAKATHQLRRFTDGRDELLGDLEQLGSFDRERLKALQAQVAEVRAQLDKLDGAFKRAIKG